jgi:hypothetical protein
VRLGEQSMSSPRSTPCPTRPVSIAYRSAMEVIAAAEPDVADAIVGELESQRRQLKLIASENYASLAVLLAMGNWLSDKYAEGTPGHRFYAGCEMVDRIETLATDHAKALFGAGTPTSNLTRGSTPTWSPTGPSLPTGSSSPPWTRLAWITSMTSTPRAGTGYATIFTPSA